MSRTVLISGASIAGPTLAYWLHRHGMKPIIVERSDGIRPGGQTVDLRGAGRTVAQRMGIEEAVRSASTGEEGVAFVDADNVIQAAFPVGGSGGEGFVAELEILRGELADLLYERTRDDTEYLFGDRISALADGPDQIVASFDRGPDRAVDLVVAADGIGSRTRRLVLGAETTIRSLGTYTAYLTIPRADTDGSWARWYNAPGGRVIALRPDNRGTTCALLTFLSGPRGYENLDLDGQKHLLRRTFADAGWEVQRVLDALDDAPDLYLEQTGQVRASSWSRGRFALLGDAGYCASPISGMGTSLALVGAYVLAGELARQPDHRDAFAAYESVMRPYVGRAQRLPPFTPRAALPRSRAGIRVLNTALNVASRPPLNRLGGSPPAEAIALPTY